MKESIKRFILKRKIPIPVSVYFLLLKLFSECKVCLDGVLFPIYGVAPHLHGKGLKSYLLPEKEWPDNYDDINNGCGNYYCPNENCYFSKQKSLQRKKENI